MHILNAIHIYPVLARDFFRVRGFRAIQLSRHLPNR